VSGQGLPRLSWDLAGSLPPPVRWPDYDRTRVTPGIVHIGIGAFHRAHQAVYIDDTLGADPGWGIVGVSLRSAATHDALSPQGNLYTAVTRAPDTDSFRVVGSVVETLVAPHDPDAVVARLADPATRIVSVTVTEAGYCLGGHGLDAARPEIVAEVEAGAPPLSMPGIVVAGLARRRANGVAPFTVLSCDNLRGNGAVTRAVLIDYAGLVDVSLARWLDDHLVCPSTMVDRIVPKTTAEDIERVSAACGYRDAWPVVGEPFGQWVIEDEFPLGRPPLTSSDVTFVSDVAPWEEMKLRLLNGSHSALAYLGLLAGHDTVAAAFADPEIRRFVTRLATDELAATLVPPANSDPRAYLGRLHTRFANPRMRHLLVQIASDGSQKLPQRLLPAARDLAAAGSAPVAIATVIAAWIRCWQRVAGGQAAFTLADPLAPSLRAAAAATEPSAAVKSVFGLRTVFAEGDETLFGEHVTAALTAMASPPP
jgi:fructuronate reductase